MKNSTACLILGIAALIALVVMPLGPVPAAIFCLQVHVCCVGALICRAIEKGRQ